MKVTIEEHDKYEELHMYWKVFEKPSLYELDSANKANYETSKRFRQEYLDHLHGLLRKYNQPKGFSYYINQDREIIQV